MDIFWAVMLIVVCLVGWALNLLSLPGNWIMLAACVVYARFGPAAGRVDIGWRLVLALLVLALAAEVIEFVAGAAGARRAGGSKRSAAMALLGSILGGILGLLIGLPIPIIGPLAGSLLFAGLGATCGAVLGERWTGREMDESLRVGEAAFWGRLLGTLGKTLVGGVMLALVLSAVLF